MKKSAIADFFLDERQGLSSIFPFVIKRIYLLAEGRLANLVVLGGHPAEIMDLSFSVQALTAEYLSQTPPLEHKVYPVPRRIDDDVARAKLATMGVRFDTLTETQQAYVTSFDLGT